MSKHPSIYTARGSDLPYIAIDSIITASLIHTNPTYMVTYGLGIIQLIKGSHRPSGRSHLLTSVTTNLALSGHSSL